MSRWAAAPGLHVVAGPPAAEELTWAVRGSRRCPFIQQTRIKPLLCARCCCRRLTTVSSCCNLRKCVLLLAPGPQFIDGKTVEQRNEVSFQGHTVSRSAEWGLEPTSWLQNPPVLHHWALWPLLNIASHAAFRDGGDGVICPPQTQTGTPDAGGTKAGVPQQSAERAPGTSER